jgi:hypothetical protein
MFSVPKKTLSHIGLLFTLGIAAYVRLLNLAQNPGWYIPMPYAKNLERAAKPDVAKTIAAVKKVMYIE